MERFSGEDIPIEQVWSDTRRLDQQIALLFKKPHHRIPIFNWTPRITLFDGEEFNEQDIERVVNIYPRVRNREDYLSRWFITKQLAKAGIQGLYYSKLGFFYDRTAFRSQTNYLRLLGEEVTHHEVNLGTKGIKRITPEELKNLNNLLNGLSLGDRFIEAIASLALLDESILNKLNFNLNPEIIMDEFFPPITLAYLLKDKFESTIGYTYKPNWKFIYVNPSEGAEENYRRAHQIVSAVWHLPKYAGYRLLMQYDGDAAALLKAHPDLAHLSAEELWDRYIRHLFI